MIAVVLVTLLAKIAVIVGFILLVLYSQERVRFNMRNGTRVPFVTVPQIERTWFDHQFFLWGFALIVLGVTILIVMTLPLATPVAYRPFGR